LEINVSRKLWDNDEDFPLKFEALWSSGLFQHHKIVQKRDDPPADVGPTSEETLVMDTRELGILACMHYLV